MILAIDIGNTNTHLGFFSKPACAKRSAAGRPDKIIASETIANTSLNTAFLCKVLKINGGQKIASKVRTILVASTNPEIEPIINEWARKIFKIKPLKVGRDFDVPIINRTDAPAKVGQDRLLNALAARKIIPGNKPIIVISCGTAITFDVVSAYPEGTRGGKGRELSGAKGEFLGGAIAPGISMMAKSLYQNCAQLPWVKLPSKKPVALGKNTQDAIISGVYFGGAGLVRNIIHELVKTLKIKPSGVRIILTGGDAETVKSMIPHKSRIIPDLTLRGLVWAYLSR